MTRKTEVSRKEFLSWLGVLLASIPLLGRSAGESKARDERAEPAERELREADYYTPHGHGG